MNECRINDPELRHAVVKRLQALVHKEIGIECKIELVPRTSISRTTSEKLD